MDEILMVEVQNIGHLGIIAAIAKKYKIVEIIDQLLPKFGNHQNLTHGQVVFAMIYQGLGLSYDRIYLAEKFFENLPLDQLFGPDVSANDFKKYIFARTLDAIFIYGPTKFFMDIGFRILIESIFGLVTDMHSGHRCQLSYNQQDILKRKLNETIFLDSKEIIAYIKNRFDVEYSISGVTALLHSLGYVYKKAKSVPGKANKTEQDLYIKKYFRLKKKAEGKIYFADSVHPQHNAIISYGCIKKGEDFEIPSNTGRYHLNINGAIDIESMDVITRSCQWVNADSICNLLKALRNKNSSGEVHYLILDNARYNRLWKVKSVAKELGIELIYQPPYSPNLNPIERLWKFFKKKVLYNHYNENKVAFEDACTKFFRYIRKFRGELSTLVTDNFQAVCT